MSIKSELLDVLYGDMPADENARLRQAISACEVCRDEFKTLEEAKRFADLMPVEALPASLHTAIIHAAKNDRTDQRLIKSGIWESFQKWLLGSSRAPQLVLLTVMLFVIIGIFVLPSREDGHVAMSIPERQTSTLNSEVEPFSVSEPIEGAPLEEEIATPIEQSAERMETLLDEELPAPRSDQPLARAVGGTKRSEARRRRPSRRLARTVPPQTAERENESENLGGTLALNDSSRWGVLNSNADRGESSTSSSTSLDGVQEQDERQQPQAAALPTEEGVAQGNLAAARGAGQVPPTTIHNTARDSRARGDCSAALTSYRRLFRQFPNYSGRSQAFLEAADCYRRLGQIAQARTLLEQASRFASTRTAARRELMRIHSTERARRRPAADTTASEEAESF